jgi:hypothetical protein
MDSREERIQEGLSPNWSRAPQLETLEMKDLQARFVNAQEMKLTNHHLKLPSVAWVIPQADVQWRRSLVVLGCRGRLSGNTPFTSTCPLVERILRTDSIVQFLELSNALVAGMAVSYVNPSMNDWDLNVMDVPWRQ